VGIPRGNTTAENAAAIRPQKTIGATSTANKANGKVRRAAQARNRTPDIKPAEARQKEVGSSRVGCVASVVACRQRGFISFQWSAYRVFILCCIVISRSHPLAPAAEERTWDN